MLDALSEYMDGVLGDPANRPTTATVVATISVAFWCTIASVFIVEAL